MVWKVAKVEFRQVTLNFTSSGQGLHPDTELLFDGDRFANAVGLTDWSADCLQVAVCWGCGIEHCEPGGWVSLRSLGDARLFVPCFEDLSDPEYAPPEVIRTRGAPLIVPHLYAALRHRLGLAETPPPLSLSDAARLVVFEAPRGVLEDAGGVYKVKRGSLVAASGQRDADVRRLEELLAACQTEQAFAACRRRDDGDVPATFYVDDPRCSEWTPFVYCDGSASLVLDDWVLAGAVEPHEADGPALGCGTL